MIIKKLTEFLNNHAKILQISFYFNWQYNQEVAEAQLIWAKDKRRLSKSRNLKK